MHAPCANTNCLQYRAAFRRNQKRTVGVSPVVDVTIDSQFTRGLTLPVRREMRQRAQILTVCSPTDTRSLLPDMVNAKQPYPLQVPLTAN